MQLLEEFPQKQKHPYECFIKKSKNHLDFLILKNWEPEEAIMKKFNKPPNIGFHPQIGLGFNPKLYPPKLFSLARDKNKK
jgi:hypothetical protein